MKHHLVSPSQHADVEAHQAPEGSKFCSAYAQHCKERCCDKNGDCPEYSGHNCHYYYDASTKLNSSNSGASTAKVDSEKDATFTNAPSSGEAAGSAKTSTTTKVTSSKTSWSRSKSNSSKRKRTESEDSEGSEGSDEPISNKQKKSATAKQVESGSTKSPASENSKVEDWKRSAKTSSWLGRALPSSFTPGSSGGIIFWALLGLGTLVLLIILYCCLCKKRYPNNANQGFGGGPGAPNMGNYGAPGQAGFAGNKVQGGPIPPSNINPTFTKSTLRLSRTAPVGMPPVNKPPGRY